MRQIKLVEAVDGVRETTKARAGVAIGAIVGIQLVGVIVLLVVGAGAVMLIESMFGPSFELFVRTNGLG